MFNFIALYILLMICPFTYNKYIKYKLNQFDLNKDGIFSTREQTVEQNRYMKLAVNDSSRNLIIYYRSYISLTSSILLFFVLLIITFADRRRQLKR